MATLTDIRAPREHADGTRSQVLRWLKRIGDAVTVDEPLLELETDKVTVEIAAPATGVLAQITKGPDEPVAPSDLLGRIEAGVASAGPAVAATPRVQAVPGAAIPSVRVRGLSPAVRRLLAENHVDPATVTGSGLGGRVTANDVLAHARRPAASAGRGAAPAEVGTAIRSVPHTPIRRRIAERMVESLLHVAPHVTTVFEADLGAVLAHRARHRDDFERQGVPLTLTTYFAIACVDAVRAVPEANSRWTEQATQIYEHLDLGIAMALGERGLIVPVVTDVGALSFMEFARRLGELTARARAGTLAPGDVRGGTFTISNHGVSGSLLATPIIINQPQSAILGIGKLEKRVAVVERDGEDVIAIRPRCYVSLTLDHRVMDGERANLFLSTFVARLQAWAD